MAGSVAVVSTLASVVVDASSSAGVAGSVGAVVVAATVVVVESSSAGVAGRVGAVVVAATVVVVVVGSSVVVVVVISLPRSPPTALGGQSPSEAVAPDPPQSPPGSWRPVICNGF